MNAQARAAIAVWRTRTTRAGGHRSFSIYLGLMIALVAVAPVARAVWLSASSPEGLAVLSSPDAPTVASLIATALWAGALLLGRERGPALHPPVLASALATSDIPIAAGFRGPLLRSGVSIAAICTASAALAGAALLVAGLTDAVGVAVFAGVGMLVGVVTTVAWLIGQAAPRAVVIAALAVGASGSAAALLPGLRPFLPSGWIALAYPATGASVIPVAPPTMAPAVALGLTSALALALLAAVPMLMNAIVPVELIAQASRWNSATTRASGLDFDTAARLYQRRPQLGRRIRAVRPGRGLTSLFLIRDAVGAIRTPGRFAAGVLGFAIALGLVVIATAPTMPGWLLGAAAGVIAYAAFGPLTDGIRHAADTAADLPLYGIGDAQLLAHHLLFPAVVAVIVVAAVIAVFWLTAGVFPVGGALAAGWLALLALIGRVSAALKGPFPPVLLTPIPTAMGDPMAAVRLAWALDGILFAALAGTSAALLASAPLLTAAIVALTACSAAYRWRHRR